MSEMPRRRNHTRVRTHLKSLFDALKGLSLLFAFLLTVALAPSKADVPPPPTTPPVPAGYCSSINNELTGDLQAFNTLLTTPPTWTPVPGGPTIYGANLQFADSNTGPSLINPVETQTILTQLQEEKAMGITAVSIPVLFPILYEPFYGNQTTFNQYVTFYQGLVTAARSLGLKVIVDDEFLFSNDTDAGWTNMNAFYSGLTWNEYVAARAQNAANVAQYLQPDYLVLANEPDIEAIQTGQQNLNIATDAAQMVAAEISAVQALNLPHPPKMGAGFGTWLKLSEPNSLTDYINAYVALPLDYIDIHVITINTVAGNNFLNNSLTVAQAAAAVSKPIAISQAFPMKTTSNEWNILSLDQLRARDPFSFWAPLDVYFLATVEKLANYTNMIYMMPEFPIFWYAEQTYGGTTANGGAANCTCTTDSCSDYTIIQIANADSAAANSASEYTNVGFGYYNQLVNMPDTNPPTIPTNLSGNAGITQVTLTWNASADDVGVAGYNVYRCIPLVLKGSCIGILIGTTTLPGYTDSGLLANTFLNYQVEAFDLANNHSPITVALGLQTLRTSADSVPSVTATTVSAQEIDLTWQPPSNTTGLGKYLIYSGTSPLNLQQIQIAPATVTTYRNLSLAGATTYYYGIIAVEQQINAPMSPIADATTLPLPAPPSGVTGTPGTSKITLRWTENIPHNGLPISYYEIFYGATSGALTKGPSSAAASYTMTGLTPGTTYYFEIVAVDTGHSSSAPSNAISVETGALPAAPVITSSAAKNATISIINWTETIPPGGLSISSFTILRGPSPSSLTKLATRGSTTFTYTDQGLTPNTTYYYGIEATDSGQNVSPISNVVAVTTPATPAAPVAGTPTANSAVRLTVPWTETIVPNGLPIKSYSILRGSSPGTLATLATRTASPFIDTGVVPNTTYYYAVKATDTDGDVSPVSNVVQATTPPMPAAPTNLVATVNSSTQITLTWTENIPSGGLGISSYAIYRGATCSSLAKLTSRATQKYVDQGLTTKTTYCYAVSATDSGGDVSPLSTPVSATTN